MRLVHNPNRWSCLLASFAMVTDIPISTLIEAIGHDGSVIVWPDLIEPMCRRSFHVQELIKAVWFQGWSVTEHQMNPRMRWANGYESPLATNQLWQYMSESDGVLCGTLASRAGLGHAVAWSYKTRQAFDSRGTVWGGWKERELTDRDIKVGDLECHTFYSVLKYK